MAKTIDHLDFMVGVTPYEHEGNNYDALRISVTYSKGYGLYVSWMPVKLTQCGYQTGPMPSSDKLVGGVRFLVEKASKNSSKRLAEMNAALELAQEGVALYFDKRLFEQLNNFMRYVALYGFTPHYQKQVENLKAAAKVVPVMRQYNDLKKKHPDAMLLFRCGDFYETYEDDAKECARILGITLTKRQSDGVAMAGFPYHALDTYLPKLVRTGHRIAICDQLDPPTGPRPKRGESETSNSSDNNQNNSEDEVMANETMKVADLIGKSISNGGNAKYTINAIEGDKVSVTFQMGDSEGKSMNMGVAQVEKLLQGGWTIGDGAAQEPTEKKADGGSQKAEEPKAKTVKMTSEREQSGTRSGSAERESSRPQGKMETEPKPKQEKPKAEKPKVTLKRKQPQTEAKAEEPKPEEPQGGRYRFSTYTRPTSDGGTKTLGRIDGLQEGDELLQRGVAEKIHASPMYDRDGERKVWWLSFGKRYVEAGRKVCQALNEGRSLDDCQAIVDAQTDENHAQSEARRKQKAERKQKREGRNHQPSDINHQTSSGKTYTEAEVADLMRRVIAGDKEAMAIVNAMAA